MKILMNEKLDNKRVVKLAGLPLMSVEKTKNTKLQSFLGGIVTAYKTFQDDYVSKDIRFLKLSTYKYIRRGNDVECYLFNHKYKDKSLGREFCRKYKNLLANHDDVYVLHANIGESVIFLRLARAYFEKMGTKKPLIIGLQEYHRDLVKMFLPDADVEIIKRVKISLYSDGFDFDDHKLRLIFPKSHYDKVEDDLRNPDAPVKHFVDQILLKLGLAESDFSDVQINIPEEVRLSLLKKVKSIDLKLDNFVFFAPEANTCEAYDSGFWYDLKREYESRGMDVYCNTHRHSQEYSDFKHVDLTLQEAYLLASYSQKIIGLRSGLLDLLVLTGRPMSVIYTKARIRDGFDKLTRDEIIDGFKFRNFENVEEIVDKEVCKAI